MKVENPAFDSSADPGTVRCVECPFTDAFGSANNTGMASLCESFGNGRALPCPSVADYSEACEMAENFVPRSKKITF